MGKAGHTRGIASIDPWPPSDPLGQALHLLRMHGAYYCRSELTAPWGMTMPPMPDYLWFHIVTQGEMLLESEGQARTVRTGELALVPHGGGHVLRSQQGAAVPDILDLNLERVSDRYEILRHGEGGAPTTLVCGAVRFAHPAARKLVEALPPIIHVESPSASEGQWIQASISLMATEARDMRPGGEAIITRAADILVVQAIRSWIETDPAAQSGWLGALRDPQIGPAISLIHSDPARPWTLDALARERAMSRSAFAARFTEVVGEPAMQYVTRWRMNLAVDSLSTRDATVAELADRLGYRSEAAFSRAFKRVVGISPGAVRRSGPTEAPAPLGTPVSSGGLGPP